MKRSTWGWIRRLAPWVVTIATIGWLLWRYSPGAIAAEMARGSLGMVIPWAVVASLASVPLMSLADFLVFRRALGAEGARRLSWWHVTRGRAGTTMLTALGYALSTGGYGVWLARRTRVGAARSVSAIVYQMVADVSAVCWLALVAALIGGQYLPVEARVPVVVVAGAFGVGLAALALIGPRAVPRRWRESRVLSAWTAVDPGTWAISLVFRIATIAMNIAATWQAARVFGLDIPLGAMAACLPVVLLVASLPVNVAGLGAVQGVWVALFHQYAPGAQLLAFQFLYAGLTMAMYVVRGAPFLPGVMKDLAPDASESAADVAGDHVVDSDRGPEPSVAA